MKKLNRTFITLLFAGVILLALIFLQKMIRYNTIQWFPGYVFSLINRSHPVYTFDKAEHILFMIADHHEPGKGEQGILKSKKWSEAYRKNISGLTDDYGRPFQYTWFYPYDHKNEGVLVELNKLVFDGLGEVEFHWHHNDDDNASFQKKIKEAVAWFNRFGVMLPIDRTQKSRFSFVHGNWALDNSIPDHCGVNRELDLLKQAGCYADFTFSNLSSSQPKMFSSIYYATDSDEVKSYNQGIPLSAGNKKQDFIIIQGPTCFDLHDLNFEVGALEDTSPFKKHRIDIWIKNSPVIQGKPEWRFVKIYTHGVQSRETILGNQFREMIGELKKYCENKGLKLHFVTARELYNIIRAAEDGLTGDPDNYRDHEIAPPFNRVLEIDKPADPKLFEQRYSAIKTGPQVT